MQRKWLVLGVLLLSLTCHRANAQVSAEIGKASAAPTIDGLANDAIWADATVHDTSEFFPDNAPDNGAADLDIQWRALWDDNNLYFLAEMTDDRLVNDDTSIFFFNDWQDDSLELYIDAQDLNVPDYQPANAPDTPAFQLTVLSGDDPTKAAAVRAAAGRGDGNPTTSSFTHGINSYADVDSATKYPQNTDTSTSTVDATNPNKWTFEAAIPWTSLFDTPANIIATRDGDFGFGVAYNDNDNETGRDSQYMWATPTYDLWMRSDTMPTVKLVDGGSQGLLGDYNKNGSVDAADYTIWKDNFGSSTNLDADGNGNGTVDAADYTVWKDNFGNTAGAAAAIGSVPEPASAALLLTLAPWLIRFFRRRN